MKNLIVIILCGYFSQSTFAAMPVQASPETKEIVGVLESSDGSGIDGYIVKAGFKGKSGRDSNNLTWKERRNGRTYVCARGFNGVSFTQFSTCTPVYDKPEDKAWLERMRQPCYEGDDMEGSPHFCLPRN